MIELTKWNGNKFILNAWHIEQIEENPDTMIILANGKKCIVKESAREVAFKAKKFFAQTSLRTAVSFQKGAEENE